MRSRPRLALFSLLPFLLFGCGASVTTPTHSPQAVAAAPARIPPSSAGQLFVADQACHLLEPVDMASDDASPEAAVRAIIHCRALARLPLAEPSVRVTDKTALVDLRLEVGTSRSLHELSNCEQLALLGAIRQTLQANPRWGILRVVFTDRGNLFAI